MLARIYSPVSVDLLFSDAALFAAMARFEMALAQAQAAQGVIPREAARAIARVCAEFGDPAAADGAPPVFEHGHFDPARVHGAARGTGSVAAPFLRHLTEVVQGLDAEAARFVNFGASEQDVLDSATAMQCKEAGRRLLDGLDRAGQALALFAQEHRRTMMLGRSLMQPSQVIALGWKAASWLDPLVRSRRHLRLTLLDAAVLQWGGRAGTRSIAGVGADVTQTVAQSLGDHLGLLLPPTSWHSARDRHARLGAEIAILCGAAGKIGVDLALLMQPEIGEVVESGPAGGAADAVSGTAARRVPVGAVLLREAAQRAPGLAQSLHSAMLSEHECGVGNWVSNWWTLRELFGAATSAVAAIADTFASVDVDADAMQANIDRFSGLVHAEAVVAALAPKLGAPAAHALVAELEAAARQRRITLRQALGRDTRVASLMNLGALERLFDPAGQLGTTDAMIDQVLGAWQSQR